MTTILKGNMSFNLRTSDLEKYIYCDELLLYNSGGVFPMNKLPKEKNNKKCFIINSDPSFLPGEHWFAVFFPTNSLPEFFDSLGRCPSYYSESLLNFLLEENSEGFVYNSKPLQPSHSSTCGLFSLYFLYYRVRGYSFEDILERFGTNLEHNDLIVINFYCNNY